MKCPKCHFDNPSDSKFCKECGTQIIPSEEIPVTETLETPKEELTTGSTFAGRYQIIEELGKGGMGSVYKAHDTEINEKVAIKLMKPEVAADKKTVERFRNELKFARKIRHKNVCQMYDLGEEKGTRYITMEYVPGEDLKRLIRKVGQMPVGKTISIAKQVCEGLAEAHKLGVIHRDLKPRNVMVDEEGNARIMDFGIARSLMAKGITGAGVMIGTPEYMSPEQAEVKEVDQRSDIYSLGVIIYEMVAGRVPFEGETPLGIAMKHKSEEPQDPRELNSQIPEDLSRVILRCMEKDKEKRYQSAGEVRFELSRIEEGIPATERVIPKRKPLTSKEITVTFNTKKLLIPVSILIAIVVIGIIIWHPWSKGKAIPIPTDKPSLAVMYFKNNTGDENLDIWRTALSDSLITDLSQSKHIRVLSSDRLYSLLKQMNLLEAKNYTSEDLIKLASRGRINHIVQGNYTKAGDTLRIEITLQEANTMELIGSERVEGEGERSIFSMVDELTKRIKKNFRFSPEQIASDIDKEVAEITTESPEAYKLYSEGRKYYQDGDYPRSIGFMQKAVAIDPEFAMAYRSSAVAFENMGLDPAKKRNLRKAFELSDRVSDRERYQIQGDFYSQSEKTYDKAIEAYRKLLELYPEDLIGNINLGTTYFNLEEWDKVIERCEVLVQSGDETFFPYNWISQVYMAKGLYEKANGVLANYLKDVSDVYTLRILLAINYFCQEKYDLALDEVNKILSVLPASWPLYVLVNMKGHIYQVRGDLIDAEKEYQKSMKLESIGAKTLAALYLLQGKFKESIELLKPRQAFITPLAYIYLRYGDLKEALSECDRLWDSAVEEEDFPKQRNALHFKGLIYLRMKSLDEAQRVAEELKELIQSGVNKKKMRLYHHLNGLIEFKRENFSKAIDNLKNASSSMPSQYSISNHHALFMEPLALAYYKEGDLEKARKEYERIVSLTTGRIFHGDIYAKSFYMLGKIDEEQGNTDRAIEHYEKFLDLWKDADPGIVEVEDARKRLAGLRSQ